MINNYRNHKSKFPLAIKLEDFERISEYVGDRYSKNELKEMLEHADKDKDGFINFAEF